MDNVLAGIKVDRILSESFKLNLVYENSILFEPYGFLSEIMSENFTKITVF